MRRFVKKPVVVEAVQWTGDNFDELRAFTDGLFKQDALAASRVAWVYDKLHDTWVKVFPSHWVIKGVQGEFYPIEPSVLEATYSPQGEP